MQALQKLFEIFRTLSSYKTHKVLITPEGDFWRDLNKNKSSTQLDFSPYWYKYNEALINAYKLDKYNNITDTIIKFYNADKQFPPDIVKIQRLYSALGILQPDKILELGCGTSSFTINTFLTRNQNNLETLTIDNDQNWLNKTKNKIIKVSGDANPLKSHQFYLSNNSLETIKVIKNFLSNSNNCLIYLDAKVIEEDNCQGMGLILEIYKELPARTTILIDARISAIKKLQDLSNKLNINIDLILPFMMFEFDRTTEDALSKECRAFAICQFNLMSTQSIALFNRG